MIAINKETFFWLDYAKALCIILVVFSHIQRYLFRAGYTDFSTTFHVADSVIHSFLFPSLCFIFGYQSAVSFSLYGRQHFIAQKIDMFFYPLALWSMVQGIFELLISNYTGKAISLADIAAFAWEPRGHFEFVYLLLLFSIASYWPLALGTTNTSPHQTPNKGGMPSPKGGGKRQQVLVAIFGSAILIHLQHLEIPRIWVLRGLAEYGVFFVAGLLCLNIETTLRRYNRVLLGILFAVFISAQYIFHITLKLESHMKGPESLLLSLIGIATLVSLCFSLAGRPNTKPNTYVLQLGGIALGIYLVHLIPGKGTRIILEYIIGIQDTGIHFIAGFTTALILSIVFCGLVTRLKLQYFFNPPKYFSAITIIPVCQQLLARSKLLRYSVGTSLIGLSIFVIGVFTVSELRLQATYTPPSIETALDKLKTEKIDIAEGERLSRILGCYYGCHGVDMQGGIKFDVKGYGRIYTSNLTQAIKNYDDEALGNAIRFGLRTDGSSLAEVMPSAGFSFLNHSELENIIAFLRQAPEQADITPHNEHSFSDRLTISIGHHTNAHEKVLDVTRPLIKGTPIPENISHGARLARLVCSECHGSQLEGTNIGPPLVIAKAYSANQFAQLLKTGIGLGDRKLGLMTQTSQLRLSFLSPDEVDQIYNFLQFYTPTH